MSADVEGVSLSEGIRFYWHDEQIGMNGQYQVSSGQWSESELATLANDVVADLAAIAVNRSLDDTSKPNPPSDTPDADELADETIGYLDTLYDDILAQLVAGQPIGREMRQVDRLVIEAMLASWVAGAAGVWLESREPRVYTLDAMGPLPEKRFPWIEDAARWLMDRNVHSFEAIRLRARDGDLSQRWKSVAKLAAIREEIAIGFPVGEAFEEFYKRTKAKLDETKPMLQMAFRTATHQAYIHGATQTLEKPMVRLQFPFVRYRSAHDTRTRATHRPLDGLMFAIGSPAYLIAQRALADFNCRCGITALTKEKADRLKLKAVEVDDLPLEVVKQYGG